MQVSNDKNCYLASCLGGVLRLVDRLDGKELNTYVGHTHQQFHVECAFTPDDSHIICTSEDGAIFFWDLVTV